MTVNMPVEVVNERCVNCPELNVDTITEENYIISGIDEDGTLKQQNIIESHLRCAHVGKCRVLYETVFKDAAMKEAGKNLRKAAPKKTDAKQKTTTRKKQADK